ncbi:cysteine hydrolase family protein [Fictibacillus phosphorivorans]|uniref:cysteine hydrolase family protein n=1 Tax=Fictibacillus phosphorivorans TaxID=1221500 RepID=UPI00203D0ACA|nr:cysteine hydrolase family protein [Fictibacillus phosphorivorans]MCM3719034.1 cysteine hydrolase [Fictibacillus phosphorivorans]MCM3776656.1 cysteine hydrolase [Fictibacillus phosphorivorans]
MKNALLVIDAQQELIDGNKEEQAVFNKETLLKNINVVIEQGLEAGAESLFVRDLDVAEGKGGGFEVHSEIHVPEGAAFFDKKATNAFYDTSLLNHLKEKEITHVVIMGCKTEHCIDTAVRMATVNGLDVTLVGDAHSTTDSTILKAQQIIEHHNKILHGHYNVNNFSVVRKTGEDLFSPIHDQYR